MFKLFLCFIPILIFAYDAPYTAKYPFGDDHLYDFPPPSPDETFLLPWTTDGEVIYVPCYNESSLFFTITNELYSTHTCRKCDVQVTDCKTVLLECSECVNDELKDVPTIRYIAKFLELSHFNNESLICERPSQMDEEGSISTSALLKEESFIL